MNRETIIKKMRDIDLIDFRDEDEDEHVAELVNKVASIVALAVAKEREECAALVQANADACDTYSTARRVLESNAAAIRARGEAA